MAEMDGIDTGSGLSALYDAGASSLREDLSPTPRSQSMTIGTATMPAKIIVTKATQKVGVDVQCGCRARKASSSSIRSRIIPLGNLARSRRSCFMLSRRSLSASSKRPLACGFRSSFSIPTPLATSLSAPMEDNHHPLDQ